jgi:formylglycine-generating enzyme required for sulfatase activity
MGKQKPTAAQWAVAREALEQAAIWHEQQDKAISKQPNANVGDNGWRRLQHQEQRDILRAALVDAPDA